MGPTVMGRQKGHPMAQDKKADGIIEDAMGLVAQREEFLETFFRKGAEFTTDLLAEVQSLRDRINDLSNQNASLKLQLASDDAIRDLLVKIEALEKEHKAYLIVYVSTSVSGIIAAVESGLAVAPLGLSYLPKHLRALGPESGFPLLPTARIVLHKSPAADGDPANYFARHVAASFRKNRAV